MTTHTRALLGGILATFGLAASLILPSAAGAASSVGNSPNGLRVSPVTTNLTINAGDTQTVTIYVQNVTNVQQDLQVVANDFTVANGDESGTPGLLLNPGEYAPSHSLKRYIAPIPDVSLKPGEEKAVVVQVTIPKNTSGGGYYGAIRFAPSSSNLNGNVTLSASVASLILVRVPGNFKEELNLASLDVRSGINGSPQVLFTSNKGLVVVARFQNVGDVQDQPFGKVQLMSGTTEIESHEINDSTPRGNVLPATIRHFSVKLEKVGIFGKYTVNGNFGYGTTGQLVSGTTTFYVVPLPAILAVVGIILVILFFIFGFPRLKGMYDSSVLQRARRRS